MTTQLRNPCGTRSRRRDRSGIASILVLVVLFLMVALLMASSRIVIQLKSEIGLVEKRQSQRPAPALAGERVLNQPAEPVPTSPPSDDP